MDLNVLNAAQLSGAAQVNGVDTVTARRQRALPFCTTHVFSPVEALPKIRNHSEGSGVYHFFEAARVRHTLKSSRDTVRNGGGFLSWGTCLKRRKFECAGVL